MLYVKLDLRLISSNVTMHSRSLSVISAIQLASMSKTVAENPGLISMPLSHLRREGTDGNAKTLNKTCMHVGLGGIGRVP